ncbi:hypothetical protein [Halarcobacter bivalviorum]|uniref:hypothetical protein n=1 Tax=Halarcobacter bivalviorum TaxID=663364 RepID=UPI00100BA853|nr:hypothetical protein [Halarcobacter bivalviorum]RXK06028.1 hypothetical protein CRU97_05775 [Halarcobacter bivalviorum]
MKKLLLIIFALILFFGYGVYEQVNKKTIKSKRVSCQEKTITFEKIVDINKIQEAIKLLQSQNIKTTSNIEYSKLMNSFLIKHYSNKELQKEFQEVISQYFTQKIENKKQVEINYYVYENDKEDTNKKNKKAKLYAGYLVFEFKLEDKLIYKIQTDYMKEDGSDIKQRIECVLKSFVSIK